MKIFFGMKYFSVGLRHAIGAATCEKVEKNRYLGKNKKTLSQGEKKRRKNIRTLCCTGCQTVALHR